MATLEEARRAALAQQDSYQTALSAQSTAAPGTTTQATQGYTPPLESPPQAGSVNDMPANEPTSVNSNTLDALREGAPPIMGADASHIEGVNTPDAALAAASGAQASDAGKANADATGYNAQTGTVDPKTMTAAGQLDKITSQDSPTMRRAAQQGMLAAARRGLQNSSIAAGTAQGAMVDRALPLAQQDAATYYGNMRANLDAMNRAAEVSTGRETDMSALNAQMAQQVELANAQARNELAALNAQLQTAVSQQNAEAVNRIRQQMADIEATINTRNAELETMVNQQNAEAVNRANLQVLQGNQELNRQFLAGEQAVDLANIQGRFQQLISSNQAAAQIYDSYISAIGSAMANHEITPSRVAQYINTMARQLEGSLEFLDAMNDLDLGGTDATSPPGAGSSGDVIYPTDGDGGPAVPTQPDIADVGEGDLYRQIRPGLALL